MNFLTSKIYNLLGLGVVVGKWREYFGLDAPRVSDEEEAFWESRRNYDYD